MRIRWTQPAAHHLTHICDAIDIGTPQNLALPWLSVSTGRNSNQGPLACCG